MSTDVGGLMNVMVGACESSLPTTTILFSERGKKEAFVGSKKENGAVRD